jgi:hypothetical protein
VGGFRTLQASRHTAGQPSFRPAWPPPPVELAGIHTRFRTRLARLDRLQRPSICDTTAQQVRAANFPGPLLQNDQRAASSSAAPISADRRNFGCYLPYTHPWAADPRLGDPRHVHGLRRVEYKRHAESARAKPLIIVACDLRKKISLLLFSKKKIRASQSLMVLLWAKYTQSHLSVAEY